MNDWNHNVVFIISASLLETAKQVSRSLDPDSGGYEAFQMRLSADGQEPVTHYAYGTPARESFAQTILALTDSNIPVSERAANLKALINMDYANRWIDITPPTLANCEVLLGDLQVIVDMSWDIALDNAGLVMINANA